MSEEQGRPVPAHGSGGSEPSLPTHGDFVEFEADAGGNPVWPRGTGCAVLTGQVQGPGINGIRQVRVEGRPKGTFVSVPANWLRKIERQPVVWQRNYGKDTADNG